jgi:amino acid adenylation domain-containing protein
VRRRFERGLEWFVAHADDASPDSKMAAVGGLLLVDPQRVAALRKALESREQPHALAFLFGLIEKSPLPVAWNNPDVFRTSLPTQPPPRGQQFYDVDSAACEAALAYSAMGRVEEPILSWMRRADLTGYNLTHQLLAWILCLKNGHRVDEARQRILGLAPRLLSELDLYPFDDLVAEGTAFLALAGFPLDRLTRHFQRLLQAQDSRTGVWRYTRDAAEQMWLVENAHLGRSPMFRLGAVQPYDRAPDPLREFRRREILHHGHTTGLALWGFGVLLHASAQAAGTRSTGLSGSMPGTEVQPSAQEGAVASELPLTYGQRALWFLESLAPGNPAYVIAGAAQILGRAEPAALHRAALVLAARHPALRTTFRETEAGPVQQVGQAPQVDFVEIDGPGPGEPGLPAVLSAAAFTPFDLARGPLWRVILARLPGGGQAMALAIHHIVSDFWSLAILVRELGALYARELGLPAAPLPELTASGEQVVRREAELLAGEEGERLWDYWRQALSGVPLALELPADRPRPAAQSYSGAGLPWRLPAATVDRLRRLGRKQGATLYMALLAGFEALLHRSTGAERMVVGCPTTGRGSAELAGLVGYLVNVVPIVGDVTGDPDFVTLLQRARVAARGAFAHQDYPLALLAERLELPRDPSRSPIFQVALILQKGRRAEEEGIAALAVGEAGVRLAMGPLELESLALPEPGAQFDLTLMVGESSGGEVVGHLQYSRDLFEAATIARLGGHLAALLQGAADDPGRSLGELPLLTAAERAELLAWNATAVRYPEGGLTLPELLARQAAATPEAVAVVAAGEALTYAGLAARANALARRLRELGVGPETVVGLCVERSLEMMVGLVAILEAGGAYLPLDPAYPPQRLAALLADAAVPVLLAQEHLLDRLPAHGGSVVLLDERVQREVASSPPVVDLAPDHLAYVIFTSGSTGRPKGVMNSHRGIVNRLSWARAEHGLSTADRVLQKTPYSFDVSVWELFWPLLSGACLVLARPGGHQDSGYLVRTIATEAITVSHFVPSMLGAFLAEPDIESCAALTRVMASGEALPPDFARQLLARLGRVELHNLYGPTEAAVEVTFWACERDPVQPGMPIGRPVGNTRIHLLDRQGNEVPVGVAGELAIGGVQVARGYLGRPELTAERFVPDPFAAADPAGGRLYRTGDLARRRPGGEIEYLGRLDHQVKLRGFRVELGEIESVLLGHPGVGAAAVAAATPSGLSSDLRLVAYVVGREGEAPAAADLRKYLGERLPEYMVPTLFVPLEALPLTASGKVDRRALPTPAWTSERRERGETPGQTRTPVEELVAAIWAEVLGLPAGARIDSDDNFFDLGGHSLLATQVVSRVRRAFRVELPLKTLFETSTLAGLAARLEAALGIPLEESVPPVVPVPRTEPLRLSFAQERLWFLDQLEPGSTSYNVAYAVRLAGQLSVAALESAFAAVLERHEALRTTFRTGEDGPVQWIAPAGAEPLSLPLLDLSALPEAVREAAARRLAIEEAATPFDLGRGPLLRSVLLRLGPEHHLAVVNVHHIVADGWSLGVLVRELAAFYAAVLDGRPADLPALPVHYADFAVWQRDWLAGEVLERQLAWWRRRLAGAPMVLELPTDRPRPPVLSARGNALPIVLPAATVAGLAALGQDLGATLFMTLFAGFSSVLSRWTGQEDLLVGSVVAGRTHRELEDLIGFFANTLVLRAELTGRPSFSEAVGRVREMTLGAYAHQDLPFERLVEALQPARDLSRSPLFQVLLVLQNQPGSPLVLPGLTLEPAAVDAGVILYELHISLTESGGGLAGTLSYASALFDRSTIERLAGHLATLLAGAVAEPGRSLSELPLLTPAERTELTAWNATAVAYAEGEWTLPELLGRQAAASPDTVALVAAGEHLSYGALAVRARTLAAHLSALGVGPETAVGLCAERSLDLEIALWAILAAGGAYVPLDPSYPAARLAAVLADAAAPVVLVQEHLLDRLPQTAARIVLLGRGAGERVGSPAPAVLAGPAPDNLAYVLFTSGSTGRAKGVMNSHRGIVNRLLWGQAEYGLSAGDRVLQKTPYSFDVSVWELFWPLLQGACLVLARPGGHQDSAYLVRTMAEEAITVSHFVPSMLGAFLGEPEIERCSALRRVLASGEALPPELVEQFFRRLGHSDLHNLYGPTEAAIEVTFWACERAPSVPGVPIGRAVANTQIRLLDREGSEVPVGVAGELAIGGVQVARGYVGRPDLTAERFVPDACAAAEGRAGARLYRTGDLARRRPGGEVEYLGRLDHQVKVRGFRIELGEIEAVLLAHPEVRAAVVVAREALPGDLRLVAYVVGGAGEAPGAALGAYLGERLPEYMVPAVFVALPSLPSTVSGKVDRRALPAPSWGGGQPADKVAPRTPVEEVLASIWCGILGLGAGQEPGVFDNFFALGGHSLLATRLVSRLRQTFDVELPLKTVFEAPTIAALAARLEPSEDGLGPAPPPLVALPREGAPALSFAQERLWLLDQLEPGNAAYNIAGAVRLCGDLSVAALAASFDALVGRHETLRTTFQTSAKGPVQAIAPFSAFTLPLIDLAGLPGLPREAEARRLEAAEAARPFDLARGPLLRAVLLRLSGADHLTLLTMHHVISDGWSLEVLVRELTVFYTAALGQRPALLPPLPVQYADFALWQRRWLEGGELARQLAWWRQQLAGAPPLLELPADRPRPAVATRRGAAVPLLLPAGLADELTGFGRESQATLFMTLLAGFSAFLGRLSGSVDLVVGSPVANRRWSEVEGLIGFFVNTLALRTDLSGEPSFEVLLGRVREATLGGYAHQDLPFEKLVEELAPERSLRHAPIFQVVLALQNAPAAALELPGLTLELLPMVEGLAKFDLTLTLTPGPAGIAGLLEYDRDLFDRPTVLRLRDGFLRLLAAAVAAPEADLGGLSLLSPAERHQLAEWGGEAAAEGPQQTVFEQFFAQAARTPEAVAVVAAGPGEETLTYGEVAARAAGWGAQLAALGVGPEVPVGLFLEPSPARIVATLAVLAAGGAYVALDAGDPAERLDLLLEEVQPPVLVSTADLAWRLPATRAQVVLLEDLALPCGALAAGGGAGAENLLTVQLSSDAAGRPQGVAVVHRGVAGLADTATVETWGALLNGGRLVSPAPGAPSPEELGAIVDHQGVTALWLSAGRPVGQTTVTVVDGEGELVPIGVAGELLVGGAGLARGYWRRPDLTAERFRPDPLGRRAGARVYRTGDRVRWLPEGRLAILGRGRQVGRQVEPDSAALPASASPAEQGGESAPRTLAEGLMRELWSEVLGVEGPQIGRDTSFFELGGNSLLATLLAVRVKESFGVDLPLKTVFEAPTIAALAVRLAGAPGLTAPPIVPVPRTGPLPLSYSQERLWFLDRLEPGSALYNIPVAVWLAGRLDVPALAASLAAVVRRHEALRTTFRAGPGGVEQVIAAALSPSFPVVSLAALPEAAREGAARRLAEAEAARPFDLARGPLLRALLLELDAARSLLVLNLHHIVGDGWSMGLLVQELGEGYRAFLAGQPPALPALAVQYADYAVWQRQWLAGEVLARQLAAWRQRLAGAPVTTTFPTDRARPAVQRFRGAVRPLAWSTELTLRLRAGSRLFGATEFMVLLAGLDALLLRTTGQEDLVVGAPIAGRTERELEPLIGLFLNTLALRTDAGGRPAFATLLARVRERTLEAYAYQDLPFERIVEALAPERSLAYAPLFQVLLVLQNAPTAGLTLPGLELTPLAVTSQTAKFDLSVNLDSTGGQLAGAFLYNRDLFDGATIERLLGQLETLVAAALRAPERPLAELPLLAPAEAQQLRDWNATETLYGAGERCLHELVEEQAGRTPAAAAVRSETGVLTFGELDRRANALAHRLRGLGVGPEVCVAIAAERSLELMIGLLGILKAGGAYLPLDMAYPAERLAYMLADSQARVLLVMPHLAPALPAVSLPVVPLDRSAGVAPLPPRPAAGAGAANLAYVLYTSGSTGRPKGAMNSHRGIVNRLLWMQEQYGLSPADRVLQKTPISFDVSVWELFWPLLVGAELVMARPGGHQDPAYLVARIVAAEITTLHFVPSMLRAFLETPGVARCTSLTRVFASGEALPQDLERLYFADLAAPLYNLYGPTEAAVDVTHWTCEPEGGGRSSVPIGRPVANTQIHLLDRELRPVPVGASGELYIGGVQLARGYRGQPALTAERFVPDPVGGDAGARLYKSGDVARWLPDGAVDFLGRIDHQVKVRGFRIELGEIESALLTVPGVRDAVVVARQEGGAVGTRLIAYLAGEASPETLREALALRLPEYMVPSAFVPLPTLPLLPNGKADRGALARLPVERAPQSGRAPAEIAGAERPQSALERALAALFAQALGHDRIGLGDSFFELGGNSIAGAILIARLQAMLGEIVHVVALFDHPTIAGLAAYLTAEHAVAVARIWGEPTVVSEAERVQLDPARIEVLRDLIAVPPRTVHEEDEPKNPRAVFVLAPPRSGSTLLRVLLGGHPQLFAPPELELLNFPTLAARRAAFSGRDAFRLEGVIRAVMEACGWSVFEAQQLVVRGEAEGWSTRRFYGWLEQVVHPRILVDKTPSYSWHKPALERAEAGFEEPLYIHLVRHPLGAIQSFEEAKLDQIFFPQAASFSRRELAELSWVIGHLNLIEFLERIPARRRCILHYEELLRQPEAALSDLCAFLGIDFQPAMLDPYGRPEGRMTDGLHAASRMLGDVKFHTHAGLDRDAAERWRESRREDELSEVARGLYAELCRRAGSAAPAPAGRPALPGCLVGLQRGGSKPPLFLVHPVFGDVQFYRHLARGLDPERPVYGFQASGFDGIGEPLARIEDMAALYCAALRVVQPRGPYLLAGGSMGGVIAYEMAQQLAALNEEVALLGLIDSWLLDSSVPPLDREEAELAILAYLSGGGNETEALRHLPPEERLTALLEQGRKAGGLPASFSRRELEQLCDVFMLNHEALRAYRPRPYAGRLVYFRATASSPGARPEDAWSELCGGRVEVHAVPGDHLSALFPPHVSFLAAGMRSAIELAEERGDGRVDELLQPEPRLISAQSLAGDPQGTGSGAEESVPDLP